MNGSIIRLLTKLMRETADKLDAGTCELTDDEAMNIISVISHQSMSKEEACLYLNLRPSQFNNLISLGEIPKGKKRRGFNELVWYKDELDTCKRKNKMR